MDNIINFYQITEQIGTAGQPTVEQFNGIVNKGYQTVVNLAMHDSDNAIPNEGSIVTGLGMSYMHLPVPFDAPSAAHVKKFIHIMQALEGEKVFVHCAVNARVSAFMHRYLTLYKGLDSQDATSPILTQWSKNMAPQWQAIMALSKTEVV